MTHPDATPTADAEGADRYRVTSRQRILQVLGGLLQTNSPVTVYFNSGADHLVTNLVALNPEFEEMIFEPGGEEARNLTLLAATPLTLVSFFNNVRVELRANHAERTVFRGADRWRARIPDSMLWFQRRLHDRIATPVVNPLHCRLPDPRRAGRQYEAVVLDLSGAGLSLIAPAAELALAPGAELEGCSLELPGQGHIAFRLHVRNILEVPQAVPPMHRFGCMFVDLSAESTARVLAYIDDMRAQREQRGRE